MKKKHLCLITPSLRRGGMERVLTLLANYAYKGRYKVSLICLIEKKVEYDLNENIKIYAPTKKYRKGFVNKVETLSFLYRTLKNIDPDSVLCFSEVFNPLAVVACKLVKVPVFISDRSSPYKVLRWSVRFLRKVTYPLANGMISQTKLAKAIARYRKYNKNITVIPNPLREINDSYEKEYGNKIISIGRLVPTKKFDQLIEIFCSIEYSGDWELIIVGDGDQKDMLLDKIKKLEVEDRVMLTGAVNDVDKYLAKGSVFAFTSISEGFPNALSEAVAFPLACVAYDCPAGPSDIIRDNMNGFLIPVDDSTTFKNRLESLMLSIDLRKKFIRDFQGHRDKYNYGKVCSDYINFIFS